MDLNGNAAVKSVTANGCNESRLFSRLSEVEESFLRF
jgi:hypothetical protein